MPMEDREVGEYGLVSRHVRRATAADGEPSGENMGEIDAHAGSRQNLAHARHDVTIIFSDLTRALSHHPNSRDTHRIGRKRNEGYSCPPNVPSTRPTATYRVPWGPSEPSINRGLTGCDGMWGEWREDLGSSGRKP